MKTNNKQIKKNNYLKKFENSKCIRAINAIHWTQQWINLCIPATISESQQKTTNYCNIIAKITANKCISKLKKKKNEKTILIKNAKIKNLTLEKYNQLNQFYEEEPPQVYSKKRGRMRPNE